MVHLLLVPCCWSFLTLPAKVLWFTAGLVLIPASKGNLVQGEFWGRWMYLPADGTASVASHVPTSQGLLPPPPLLTCRQLPGH